MFSSANRLGVFCEQLAVEKSLKQSVVVHAVYVASPSKLRRKKCDIIALTLSTLSCHVARSIFLKHIMWKAVECPRFVGIKLGLKNYCSINSQHCEYLHVIQALQNFLSQSAKSCAGSGNFVGHPPPNIYVTKQSATKVDELVCNCQSLAIQRNIGFDIEGWRCWLVQSIGILDRNDEANDNASIYVQVHA